MQKIKKKNLWIRAQIIQAVRTFFIDNDYLEIETPIRIPAPAPEAHIDAEVSGDWFLHTSPELCNAFTELIDPVEQRIRFENEQKIRSESGKQVYPLPEKFLESLQLMPEASGVALGIDRLVMLFTNTNSIDDVVAFTPEEL